MYVFCFGGVGGQSTDGIMGARQRQSVVRVQQKKARQFNLCSIFQTLMQFKGLCIRDTEMQERQINIPK